MKDQTSGKKPVVPVMRAPGQVGGALIKRIFQRRTLLLDEGTSRAG